MTFTKEAAQKAYDLVSPLGVAKKVQFAIHTENDGGLLDTFSHKLAE